MPQNAEQEEWRPVVGWEGIYEVSSLGRVQSLPRVVPYRIGSDRRFKGKMMAVHRLKAFGHTFVGLKFANRKATVYVHRLVLEAFVGPCPDGMEACHFPDRDTSNNRLCNLRWATHLENMEDRRKHGSLNGKMNRDFTPEHRLKLSEGARRNWIKRKAGKHVAAV